MVTEVNPDRGTALTKQNLFQLLQVYDLQPFLFTKSVHIQTGVVPKYKPVLTLNTQHSVYPSKLLAIFLHEEFHWWIQKNPRDTKKTIDSLKLVIPNLTPDVSAHLIVCYLEYRALVKFLGQKEATRIVRSFTKKDTVTPWMYEQMITTQSHIKNAVEKNRLLPRGF